jgi:hypothetical protein
MFVSLAIHPRLGLHHLRLTVVPISILRGHMHPHNLGEGAYEPKTVSLFDVQPLAFWLITSILRLSHRQVHQNIGVGLVSSNQFNKRIRSRNHFF